VSEIEQGFRKRDLAVDLVLVTAGARRGLLPPCAPAVTGVGSIADLSLVERL
jgi:hypothetical protein